MHRCLSYVPIFAIALLLGLGSVRAQVSGDTVASAAQDSAAMEPYSQFGMQKYWKARVIIGALLFEPSGLSGTYRHAGASYKNWYGGLSAYRQSQLHHWSLVGGVTGVGSLGYIAVLAGPKLNNPSDGRTTLGLNFESHFFFTLPAVGIGVVLFNNRESPFLGCVEVHF